MKNLGERERAPQVLNQKRTNSSPCFSYFVFFGFSKSSHLQSKSKKKIIFSSNPKKKKKNGMIFFLLFLFQLIIDNHEEQKIKDSFDN